MSPNPQDVDPSHAHEERRLDARVDSSRLPIVPFKVQNNRYWPLKPQLLSKIVFIHGNDGERHLCFIFLLFFFFLSQEAFFICVWILKTVPGENTKGLSAFLFVSFFKKTFFFFSLSLHRSYTGF